MVIAVTCILTFSVIAQYFIYKHNKVYFGEKLDAVLDKVKALRYEQTTNEAVDILREIHSKVCRLETAQKDKKQPKIKKQCKDQTC